MQQTNSNNPTATVSQNDEATKLSFNTSKFEHELCNAIANRAVALAKRHGIKYKKVTALMDVTACHASGNPLHLDELLKADDANFGHDVFGIRRHIDRSTGQLLNCFVPRFSI